ncbi:uncharacterized protein LODBEIA_P60510 [Lodderomyces beijingensis]|uniref:Ethionine resistance protein n=1 Tax=Lodderomyces beijingensis TaxID=1775926 RepID=A0ABP0ZVW2_9ASCO
MSGLNRDDGSFSSLDEQTLTTTTTTSNEGAEHEALLDKKSRNTPSSQVLNQEASTLSSGSVPAGDYHAVDGCDQEEELYKLRVPETTTSMIELRALVRNAIPSVVTFLLECSPFTVSVFAVGHIGANELAAVSLGSMTANITGYATIQGISTALDTLCPQAFGAKNYTLVGDYMQKCIALSITFMFPILICWIFFGYDLIRLVVKEPETARLAATYLRYVAFGIPGFIGFECGKRFLQAQEIYQVGAYVLLIAAPINVVMTLSFVKWMGYAGAPIAVSINYWFMALLLFLATTFMVKADKTPHKMNPLQCWGGLDVHKAFSRWGQLASLAIPGLIMIEAEFIAFEIMTLLASLISTKALAAQSIGTTIAYLTYQVPFAIGIAASTRIANFLGAGLAESAKITTRVSLIFGFAMSLVNCAVILGFQRQIAYAFTNDEEVVSIVLAIIWFIAVMQVSDGMNANTAGCLRGQGQTKVGGIVNVISYYVVGVPISIYLSFFSPWKGLLAGLWIGSTVALTLIGGVQCWYALGSNFETLCENARKRTIDTIV